MTKHTKLELWQGITGLSHWFVPSMGQYITGGTGANF